ncbi:extradiol ring-cleavage dioxygenase, class III [Skeletonema marinoi]|uniref:Extradiol ring-cleavage dioxygenase, class III n=1 Tax=Skeletonema marinoi TaxID=267567 RepID=A0AAD8YJG1_9STRA|nr:extradiol ring-cleavage dioxygenase, class III [Skeletonema marinoi]
MNHPTVLFISHGGGPLPLLGDPKHAEMNEMLPKIASKIPKPDVILMLSAHWEEDIPTFTAASDPPLIYDYYGFPKESYEIQYPAKGQPDFARKLKEQLQKEGIKTNLSFERGFDHGMFVPLKIMYPNADIPVVQLSLATSLDPEFHIAMGRAIRKLPYDSNNVLLIGSGFSFHNMKAFFAQPNTDITQKNRDFDNWLQETMSSKDMSEEDRQTNLIHWNEAPSAEFCHPRNEHLLPLHVCYGAAGRASDEAFSLQILDKQASMFLWNAAQDNCVEQAN